LYINETSSKLKEKENKRDKCKDLMTAFKQGQVQKDMNFKYYFEDNIFLELSRKDSVTSLENEINKLNREILLYKEELSKFKGGLIDFLIGKKINLSELDFEIERMIEEEYFNKIVTKRIK
jgi:hypothetical protein